MERFKDELLTNQVLNSHDSLQEMLLAAFQVGGWVLASNVQNSIFLVHGQGFLEHGGQVRVCAKSSADGDPGG